MGGPKCACTVPVGVNGEISGTQTALHGECNASVCVCWGVLPACSPLGTCSVPGVTGQQGPARAGGLPVPPPSMLPSSWQRPSCRQGRAEAVLQLGFCLWLEGSEGADGKS